MKSSVVLAFLLGACSSAVLQSQAAPGPGVDAHPASTTRAPSVIALANAPKRTAPPGTASVQELARGDNAFVGRLEMDPGAAVPEHRDTSEEYIHILSGGGTMHIDDTRYELSAGDTAFMPRNAKVRFQNGAAPLVALQVFADPTSSEKYERWAPSDASSVASPSAANE